MDPILALKQLRERMHDLANELESLPDFDPFDTASEVVELWQGLDNWMSNDGFNPWNARKDAA